MAGIIAIVADGMATWVGMFSKADLITLVADVKATGSLFSLSSMLLIRMSSHM